MSHLTPNPYKPTATVDLGAKTDAAGPAPRPWRDATILAVLAFGTAPIIWTALCYFIIYLADTGPNDGGLTRFEKFDTFYGLLTLTFAISLFVAPIVFVAKMAKG